jgi:hypothetical protein
MKSRLSIVLLTLLLAHPAFPHSNLWIGGVGEPVVYSSARSMGMGGVTIAIPHHLPQLNPATIVLDKTSVSLTGLQEAVSVSADDGSALTYDFRFPQFAIAFPLPWKSSLDATYRETIVADFALSREDTVDGEPYVHELSRDGSIGNLSVGLSTRIEPVALGARAVFSFGSYVDEQRIDLESTQYVDAEEEFTRELDGFGYELGALITLAQISAGGYYRLKNDVGDGLTLPASYGVGLSYSHAQILVGLDYTSTQWNDSDADYDNSMTIATGLEYVRRKTTFRAGYRFGGSYLNDITEHAITGGIGFSPTRTRGMEFALELGLRSDVNDTSERFARLGCTFWGLEGWERRKSYP